VVTISVTAPDGGQDGRQGHCSRCHKVWVLEERQGICPWCGRSASCQTNGRKPRHSKSRSTARKRQANGHGNGYDHLEGRWLQYYKIASRFAHKAKAEDTQDLLHDIIITLAAADRNNGHRPFTEAVMYRIASRVQAHYWYRYYNLKMGLDCGHCSRTQRQRCKEGWLYGECPKAVKVESLNQPVIDGEGNTTELGELIADDAAIDLDAWVSSSTWELSYPKRLVAIAYKLHEGDNLTPTDSQYLWRFRKQSQKKFQDM
jgi:hypothetical protein